MTKNLKNDVTIEELENIGFKNDLNGNAKTPIEVDEYGNYDAIRFGKEANVTVSNGVVGAWKIEKAKIVYVDPTPYIQDMIENNYIKEYKNGI